MSFSNKLHIFGQPFCHDDAYIVGDEEGLLALRDALNTVLSNQKQESCNQSFTNDGEGFKIIVMRKSSEEMDEIMLPYTDSDLGNWENSGKHPVEFFDRDSYRKLIGR